MFIFFSDQSVRIWNLNSPETQILEGHTGAVNDLYSNGKFMYSVSADATVKMWDTNYGKCYHSFTGHTDEIIACTPFGQNNLATASFDTQVKIWDMEKCTLVCTLSGHKFRISSMVAFENKIITSSWDKTVKVRDFVGERY